MNFHKPFILIFTIVFCCILQSNAVEAQNILQRLKDRMEKGREDGRLVDRMKKRVEDAKKAAESTAKDLEDKLKGNQRDQFNQRTNRREPTLADPRTENQNDRRNQTFGARPQNKNFGTQANTNRGNLNTLRGAVLQQNGARVLVTGVQPQSPAGKSGLLRGDVITELAGFPIKNLADIGQVMDVLRPADRVMLNVVRNHSKKEILLEADGNNENAQADGFAPGPINSGTVGSGAIGNTANGRGQNAESGYPNSIRSVLDRVRQTSSTGNDQELRIEMRQEINELRNVVERQNQTILQLQKELNSLRSRSNQQNDGKEPQLLGPRRSNR